MRVTGWRMVIAVLGLAAISAMACGTEEAAGPECESNSDCDDGEFCDAVLGLCEQPRNNSAINSSQSAGNNTQGADVGVDDTGTADTGGNANNGPGNDDPGPITDDVGNGGDDTGDDPPPIIPPEEDTGTEEDTGSDNNGNQGNGGDADEPCTQEFDACDPSESHPGDFICLETDEDGSGNCFMSCEQTGSASNCATERYCRSIADETVCAPSECSTHSDCDGGTCISLDNAYGFCSEDGTGSEGTTCQGGESGQCAQGLACDASSGQSGECRYVCDPWNSTACIFGEVCTVRWNRTGLCTTDETFTGYGAFDSCSPAGSWCSDAVLCVEASDDNLCLEYCRPGMQDCGFDMICDETFIWGNDALGVCMPPCSSEDDCGGDYECVSQRCRLPCTTQSDCCDPGDTDCSAQCDAGYCI